MQLRVTDVARSEAWYTAALGLEPMARDLDLGYVALRHRGARLVVVLTADPGSSGTDPSTSTDASTGSDASTGTDASTSTDAGTGPSGPLDHLAFAVADGDLLASWAEHLRAIGIAHPGVVLENGNPSLQLRDPDGIAIELVAAGPPTRPRSDAPAAG